MSKYRKTAIYITAEQFEEDIIFNYGYDTLTGIVAYFMYSQYDDKKRSLWSIPFKYVEIALSNDPYVECLKTYYEDIYPGIEMLIVDWGDKSLIDLPFGYEED